MKLPLPQLERNPNETPIKFSIPIATNCILNLTLDS